MNKLILTSASPRRKELLEQVGVDFEIYVAHGEEIMTCTQPHEIVEELSLQKVSQAQEAYGKEQNIESGTVFVGADTIVAYDNEIMGKPKDEADAVSMLTKLQNHTHQVYTGVSLIAYLENGRKVITFHEKTDVIMYPMTQEEIKEYVATKEPMDKAGSYAIQGRSAAYIKGICGDYNNVVGLPVARLLQELKKL